MKLRRWDALLSEIPKYERFVRLENGHFASKGQKIELTQFGQPAHETCHVPRTCHLENFTMLLIVSFKDVRL